MQIELFELVNAEGVSMSPFVWRARCSLLLKGLHWDSLDRGFTDPREGYETFPALAHDGEIVRGSWDIAEYLEERFIDRPRLFGNHNDKTLASLTAAWVDSQLLGVVWRTIVADIHDVLRPEDQDYFRTTREKRLGTTLEEAQSDQRAKGDCLGPLLEPARRLFSQQDFFGGGSPLYPDFTLFGMFQWARINSEHQFLGPDDRVAEWLDGMDHWLDRQETMLALRYA